MTFFSIRFARLAALSLLLATSGCTINTYESSQQSSGDEEPKEKPKKKKKKKPSEEKPEKPEARPEKPKPEKPKPEKPKPEKPASKPDKPRDEPVVDKPKDDKPKGDKPVVDKPKDDKPKDDKPVVDKPKDDKPAPQPDRTKIVLPIKIALEAIEKELDALIPANDKKDWQQITKGEESPKAELKYELWRDPIKLDLDGHTFQIKVPVRYAATVRAQAKNPITKDWFWIAKSETWGTKDEPQRLTAYFEAKLSVNDTWKIESDLKLVKLEHGDPPSGEICKNAGVKVCVEKSSIADEVREGINKKLEPKLKKALAQVDAKVERAFDLHKRATTIWTAMQKPQALPDMPNTWLVMEPSSAGVRYPVKDGQDIVVELAIEGKLTVETGPKATPKATPLPKVTRVEGPSGFHIVADLRIPRAALASSLEKPLKGLVVPAKNAKKLSVARARVSASTDPKLPNRITVKLAFDEKSGDELELQGDVLYDAERQRLYVGDIDISPASRAVAAKLGELDLKALEREVETRARWDLNDEAGPLKKAILSALDATLRGQVTVKGELKELDVQKLELKPDVIEARVIVGGKLEVEVKR
jgi:hypothetical protein